MQTPNDDGLILWFFGAYMFQSQLTVYKANIDMLDQLLSLASQWTQCPITVSKHKLLLLALDIFDILQYT